MGKFTFHLIKKLTGIDIEQLQNDNEALLIKNQQLSFEVKDANKEATYKRTQLTETQEELSLAQTELTQLQTSIAEHQKEISHLQTEISRLQSDKATGLEKMQYSEQEIVSRDNDIQQLKNQLANSERQKEVLSTDKKELEEKLAEAEKQKETITASKKELEAKLTEAEKQKETIAASKKELEEKLTEAEKQKETIATAKKELEEKLTEAEKQKETIAAGKKELEAKLAEVEQQKETIATAKKELEEKLTEAEKQKETIAAGKKELEAKLAEVEQQKETIAASKKELEEKLAEAEKQKETIAASKKELEEKLTEVEKQKEILEANKKELEEQSEKSSQDLTKNYTALQRELSKTQEKLDAIQSENSTLKARLEESTLHYPYTRITSETNGCQYIYESRTLQLKAELFIWGVEGKEVVLEENHFIPYNEIAKIEGMETPFATDVMTCDFSEEGNGEEVAEALLMAICCYHPIHITYRDKNGRISERNLYWICFQPQGISSVRLPYEKIFRDMFDGEIDTDHIMAMCAHTPVPRIFTINQILSIQIYDAFVTTRKGIDTQIDGMYYAVLASQSEAADMIYKCLPEQFKKLPAVISYRAHYWMLEGDYQKAMKLYLSFAPDTEVEKGKTWAAMNIANFDKFIDNDVEAERFLQLKEALKEEGWPI